MENAHAQLMEVTRAMIGRQARLWDVLDEDEFRILAEDAPAEIRDKDGYATKVKGFKFGV